MTPLHPDPRRLRATFTPKPLPSIPDIIVGVLHPLHHRRRRHRYRRCPESLSSQLPLPSTFFCPTIRHSRVHRDKAAASMPFYQLTEKISEGSCRAIALVREYEYEKEKEREREKEQPSGMLRECKHINTPHVYAYIARALPLAFVWPRETARTFR